MNVDRAPKKRGGQYGQRRGHLLKGSYKQQNHRKNPNDDFNSNNASDGPSDIVESFCSLNVAQSCSFQGPRQSDHYYRNYGKPNRNYSQRFYGNSPDYGEVAVSPSQRGQIVGGRYMRKQGKPFSYSTKQKFSAQQNGYSSQKYGNSSDNNNYGGCKSQGNNICDRSVENDTSESSHSSFHREYISKKLDSPYESMDAHSTLRDSREYNIEKYDGSTASHSHSNQTKECSHKKYDISHESTAAHSTLHNSREYSNKKYNSSNECHSSSYSPREYNNKKSNEPQRRKYSTKKYEDISGTKDKSSLPKSKKKEENNATQRELLMDRLKRGECECLVCVEPIRMRDQVWHCLGCYHILHLRCIKKWARSPAAATKEGSWRCPACQSLSNQVPQHYYCFCGATKNPEMNYHLTPHSCGEVCNRLRPECSHSCKELCHPGPCPPCAVVVQKTCHCQKTYQVLPCNQSMEISCLYVCEKLLNCEFHKCKSKCHEGDCPPCKEMVEQRCHCGKSKRQIACTTETASRSVYSCMSACGRTLSCGRHTCTAICHPGDCGTCHLSLESVQSCCCGKTRLEKLVRDGMAQERTSCEDPVPVCGMVCMKMLFCGPKETPHACQSLCHKGDCPPCPLSTSVKCSCGSFSKDFPCTQITSSFTYQCQKRCNRRKECGRHRCLNNCCTSKEHQKCELVCNKKLSCGLHLCQEMCHMGNCPTCWNVSFDELRCYCGTSVLYPPIPCGTRPPECTMPCTRNHPCDHDVKHTCHSDDVCPPCTSLTTKWCYGQHKQCGPVMCFLEGVSCGMPCQKPLPCGRHKCRLTCHAGECLKESEKCTQPCSVPRPSCGHPCAAPCHDGPCIETPCKTQVTSTCPCKRRSETSTCFESSKSYRLMSSTILATKMQEIKDGQSVNLNDVLGKKSKNSKLQCNEECAVIERNKRLALALQIQNPDLSCSPGPPNYSEYLKEEAKKNPHFVADIYDKLSNLVQLATESKHKSRRHAFPPMNRDQRRVVHELAEFFGCETQSYDDEPKRNIVATAVKNKCWLPFTNIMAVVNRDMGIRKGPSPMLAQRDPKNAPPVSSSTQKKKIDYFDYNE